MNIDELLRESQSRPMRIDVGEVVRRGKRRQLKQRITVGLVSIAGAAAAVGVVAASQQWHTSTVAEPASTSAVHALPPPTATPLKVVETYLKAAKEGDCVLTERLTLDHTFAWCGDPKLIDFRGVTKLPGQQTPGPGSPVVQAITFELNTAGSSDRSIAPGWTTWTFLMAQGPDGWRLYDQGSV